MSSEHLNLRPISKGESSNTTSKPIPTSSLLKPWEFDYAPSRDGNDLNLLIMFHGLGDTKTPFFNLAQQLNLPSTAVMSLQAPDPLPLMDNPSFSWYNTFDPYFNPLPQPSPSKPLPNLLNLLNTLTSPEIGWEPTQIHLFGWGQGGTMALELGVEIHRHGIQSSVVAGSSSTNGTDSTSTAKRKRIGSIVSICGGLLSTPTEALLVQTPTLYFNRLQPNSAVSKKVISTLEKSFKDVQVLQGENGGEAMPRGKKEWEGVMKFWAKVLARKDEDVWKGQGEVYEVIR